MSQSIDFLQEENNISFTCPVEFTKEQRREFFYKLRDASFAYASEHGLDHGGKTVLG